MESVLNYEQKLCIAAHLVENGRSQKAGEDDNFSAEKVMEKCSSDWGISANLKPHQALGVSWLIGRYIHGVNVILGDEMGLGKTLQAICLLAYLKFHRNCKGPFLVLCPLSVIDGWETEFSTFCSTLRVLRYVGNKEERRVLRTRVVEYTNKKVAKSPDEDLSFDVCLTTYDLAMLDANFLSQIRWHFSVIDEAQRIKNASSVLYNTLQQQFMIPRCLLLTGTPVQNNLSELWALLHFCMPQVFGELQDFISVFKQVATMKQDDYTFRRRKEYKLLRYIVHAFMLRRTKALLIKNGTLALPPLSEVTVLAPLVNLQKKIYASVLRKELPKLLVSNSTNLPRQSLQNILMQLRKTCSHPYLFPGVEPEPFEEGEHLVQAAGKLIVLDILLEKLHMQGHRVLVFAQMTRTIDILQDYLEMRNYSYERLDGSVRAEERFAAVKRFGASSLNVEQSSHKKIFNETDAPFVFLISTRAGGVGLNLTGADTVIFYEQDWNPQVDKQALQRTHRIGQKRHVLSVNIVTENTVEEVIMHRAKRKMQLCQNVIGNDDNDSTADSLDSVEGNDLHSLIIFGLHKLDTTADSGKSPSEINLLEMRNMAEKIMQVRNGSKNLDDGEYKISSYEMADEKTLYTFTGSDVSSKQYSDKDIAHGTDADQVAYGALLDKVKDESLKTDTEEHVLGRKRPYQSSSKELEAARAEKHKKLEEKKHARWEQHGYESLAVENTSEDDESLSNSDPGEVKFVFGDCTTPLKDDANEATIILSCVDNSGSWGKGGMFDALSRLSEKVPDSYTKAHEFGDLHLGDLHLIPTSETDTSGKSLQWVALAVVQTYNARRKVARSDISLPHLETCLKKLAKAASQKSASIHMPRIGFRQGEGHKEWYTIERLLHKYATNYGVKIYVYYFKRPGRSQSRK